MSEWIRIDQCAPLPNQGKIFVYNLTDNYGPFVLADHAHLGQLHSKWTHWMPAALPDPPKPEEHSQHTKDLYAFTCWRYSDRNKDNHILSSWEAALSHERKEIGKIVYPKGIDDTPECYFRMVIEIRRRVGNPN